jgi:hypothetical protein
VTHVTTAAYIYPLCKPFDHAGADMKKVLTGFVWLFAALALSAHARDVSPWAGLWYQGSYFGFDLQTFDGTGYPVGGNAGTTLDLVDSSISYSGYLNPDPFISYSVGVTNFSNVSQSYAFTFFTPLFPMVTDPSVVTASISGGLSDLFGDGVTFTPTAAFAQMSSVGGPLTDLGVDVGGAASGSGGAAGANYTYGSFASGLQSGPAGSWSFMQTTLSFTLTPHDSVALTGFVQITPVPEPSELLLLISGLFMLGFAGRCDKRA